MAIKHQYISRIGAILVVILHLVACCETKDRNASTPQPNFRLPTIPSLITNQDERMEYLAIHYWDQFNFGDTLMMHNDSIRGVAMAGYATLLERVADTEMIASAIERTLDRSMAASRSAFDTFAKSLESYLYDPNSPLRNEELYIPVLRYIVASDSITEIDKLRPRYQLNMALKNRIGTIATDFEYITPDGTAHTMHSVDAEYTVLFFNNPDCEECARVKSEIASMPQIAELHTTGRLAILAIDAESEIELWRDAVYPDIMINGYDSRQTIMQEALYDLKAIPTLYLLDADKRILLKDCTLKQAISHIPTPIAIK